MAIGGGPSPPGLGDRSRGFIEPLTERALADLKGRLISQFGQRVVAVYLYGSRARGDHQMDSDVDVAVAFSGDIENLVDLDDQLIDVAYPVQLETGLYMQLWALEAASLSDPASHRRAEIAEAVLRDGIPV
ncbi:MAG: nucleotidyltransferase domain-containing protein [Proteobacteria bacterium]|nr:nucleotidyltransferase domain-containing protein [Pseudomonadota bacterium]